MSVSPLTSGSGTLAYLVVQSGSQTQVTGSPKVASFQSPGSVIPTSKEATTESTRQQRLLPQFYRPFRTRLLAQPPSLSRYYPSSQAAEAPPSTLPSSMTVSLSRREAGLALHDHRDLVVSLPSDVSELLAVSEHTEEVETTLVPVETLSVNSPSQGCTTLPGIKSISLDLCTANQVGQAASSSALQTTYINAPTIGSFLRPPSLLLNFGLVGTGPRFSYGFTAILWFNWGPWWDYSSVFSDVSCQPQVPSMGSGGSFPLFWLLDRFDFAESRAL